MPTKHEAIDSKGQLHKRTSAGRTYTHCIVRHYAEWGPDDYGRTHLARSKASWASSLALAQKDARIFHGNVEIIEAKIT
jgi:hypothetical protein